MAVSVFVAAALPLAMGASLRGPDWTTQWNLDIDLQKSIMDGSAPGESDPIHADWWCLDHNMSDALMGEAVVNASANETESVDAMVDLGLHLQHYCLGEHFDGRKCQEGAQELREQAWRYLVQETSSYESLHLGSNSTPPPVKQFWKGGGIMREVPCRKDGKMAHLYYRHIFKCAGFNIKKNLAVVAGKPTEKAVDTDWDDHHRCNKYKKENDPKNVLFTFVRNPIDKFVKGYKEIAGRGEIDVLGGARVGTKEHALAFLDNVWHGTCDNWHMLLQVQNFFGKSCESKFDFIGRLERFDEDWKALGTAGGCDEDQPLGWEVNESHPSGDLDHGAEKMMVRVLRENKGTLMRSLCFWVLPDFLTFNYTLPSICKSHPVLRAVVDKVRSSSTAATTTPANIEDE